MFQAQLVPQLIINYKLKVRQSPTVIVHVLMPSAERGTHADESHDLQNLVHGR